MVFNKVKKIYLVFHDNGFECLKLDLKAGVYCKLCNYRIYCEWVSLYLNIVYVINTMGHST